MNKHIYIFISLFLVLSCQSQTKKDDKKRIAGGSCEGCEAIYEYGNKKLSSTDTLPKFNEAYQKLKIEGTIFLKDGKLAKILPPYQHIVSLFAGANTRDFISFGKALLISLINLLFII